MAVLYGMTIKEFWEEDPNLFWIYRYSYLEKIDLEQKIYNHNAWLQGAYFYEAVSVALCNAFSKSKAKYPKEPYYYETSELTEEEKQKQIKMQVEEVKARIKQINKMKGGEKGERTNCKIKSDF